MAYLLDALIDRAQRVELPVGKLEQRPVRDTRPAQILNRSCIMAWQLAFEPLRHALTEKKAHA